MTLIFLQNVQRLVEFHLAFHFIVILLGSNSQNEFFITGSLLTVARGNFRSSGTAKFNVRYEDFFTARAYLHQEAIFAIE